MSDLDYIFSNNIDFHFGLIWLILKTIFLTGINEFSHSGY
jgi:hypothetical protein